MVHSIPSCWMSKHSKVQHFLCDGNKKLFHFEGNVAPLVHFLTPLFMEWFLDIMSHCNTMSIVTSCVFRRSGGRFGMGLHRTLCTEKYPHCLRLKLQVWLLLNSHIKDTW